MASFGRFSRYRARTFIGIAANVTSQRNPALHFFLSA